MSIRALWLVRKNLTEHPGGDTVQVLQTAEALRGLGVTVDLRPIPCRDFAGYDLVHLFHLDRLWEHLDHCRRLRRAGVPAALSTIYWPSDAFDRGGRAGVQGRLARLFGSDAYRTLRVVQRGGLAAWEQRYRGYVDLRLLSFHAAARRVLDAVAVLLPNSEAERRVIEEQFGVSRPAVAVPNAVDRAVFLQAAEEGTSAAQRSGVLCVGRIEPRKNQLALIRALADTDISLTLVGHTGRYSGPYGEACRAAAGGNVSFLEHRPPAELRKLYARASVHACVSWYETPGLASLEAAACGCAVVVTPGGSTREYFADDAHYCEPTEPASIRAAVEAALRDGPRPALPQRIAQQFTWEMAARQTLAGYELALGGASFASERRGAIE